jgi:excisionase family DNA binding protein
MKRSSANHKNEEIMTVSSLADYIRCSPSMIYRLLKRKEIPAFRLGSDWRFFRSAIDDWIEHQETTTATSPPADRGSAARAARRKLGRKRKVS